MRIALILLSLMLAAPAVANAASVAYIENGEVWVASLDGTSKVRLAGPVPNGAGAMEKWVAVAASDGGRIVAVRNEPGKTSKLSWMKVWEPNGTSTVEGPLTATSGWFIYVYPLSLDITADGAHMVYGYSNSTLCCPTVFGRGTYVRPVSNSVLAPITIEGYEEPTLIGSRVIAKSGNAIYAQTAGTSTYDTGFEQRLDVSAIGLEPRRTDVAANGKLVAIELEQWDNGTQKIGRIAMLSVDGVDGNLTGAVDCFLPATGIAKDVSLSQDGRFIAWTDDGGLKVAGAPASADDPCVLTSPPVVIAAAGTSASIGGADIAAYIPADPVSPPPGSGGGTPPAAGGGTSTPAAPTLTLPAKLTAKALAKGVSVVATVPRAGKVTYTATIGSKKVASGAVTAKGAGKVTIKLKLTKAGRKLARKGKTLTLKVTAGGKTVTKKIKLR
jgi:hypothetical protein